MTRSILVALSLLASAAAIWFLISQGKSQKTTSPPGGSPVPPEVQRFDATKVIVDPATGSEIVADELVVTLVEGVSEAEFLKGLEARSVRGVRVVGRVPAGRLLQLEVAPEQREVLRRLLEADTRVAAAGNNRVWRALRTFNDPLLGPNKVTDWGLDRIGAPAAWDLTTGGALVGVIDSGARLAHEELVGKIVAPYSFATGSATMQHGRYGPHPSQWIAGHGTHVAITIAGTAGNGRGTAGVAPDSPVVPVQSLFKQPSSGRLGGSNVDVLAGIQWAIDAGAQVINMSLGNDVPAELQLAWQSGSSSTRAEIDRVLTGVAREELRVYASILNYAEQRGVIIVKAAGNDSLPARWDGLCLSGRVIGVAATNAQDGRSIYATQLDGRLGGSRHGPGTTVSAPGSVIWSGFSDPATPYMEMGGTSMAAPHVAGVVALMKTLKPNLRFAEARDILVATGTSLATDKPIGPLVNAPAALRELQRRIDAGEPAPPSLPPLEPGPPLPPAPLPPPNPTPVPPPGAGDPGGPPVDGGLPPPGERPAPPEEGEPGGPAPDPDEMPDPDDDVVPPPPPPPDVRIDPPTDPDVVAPSPAQPPTFEEVLAGPSPWLNAEVRRKIDAWLAGATPPPGGRYNRFGVAIDIPGVIVRTPQSPDWAATKYQYLFTQARRWKSQNLGTLHEYLNDLPYTSTVTERTSAPKDTPADPAPRPGTPDPGREKPAVDKKPGKKQPADTRRGANPIGAESPRALLEIMKRLYLARDFETIVRSYNHACVDSSHHALTRAVTIGILRPKTAEEREFAEVMSDYIALLRRRGYRTAADVRRADIFTLLAIAEEATFELKPESWVYLGEKPVKKYVGVVNIDVRLRDQNGKQSQRRFTVSRVDGRWYWGYNPSTSTRGKK